MVLKWSKEIVRNGLLLPFLLCLIYQALRVKAYTEYSVYMYRNVRTKL